MDLYAGVLKFRPRSASGKRCVLVGNPIPSSICAMGTALVEDAASPMGLTPAWWNRV